MIRCVRDALLLLGLLGEFAALLVLFFLGLVAFLSCLVGLEESSPGGGMPEGSALFPHHNVIGWVSVLGEEVWRSARVGVDGV